jgi:hypothetical protein
MKRSVFLNAKDPDGAGPRIQRVKKLAVRANRDVKVGASGGIGSYYR